MRQVYQASPSCGDLLGAESGIGIDTASQPVRHAEAEQLIGGVGGRAGKGE
jgi:hypothetical protein